MKIYRVSVRIPGQKLSTYHVGKLEMQYFVRVFRELCHVEEIELNIDEGEESFLKRENPDLRMPYPED